MANILDEEKYRELANLIDDPARQHGVVKNFCRDSEVLLAQMRAVNGRMSVIWHIPSRGPLLHRMRWRATWSQHAIHAAHGLYRPA